MSFLSAAFAIGAASIALPILFHLIRRTPKEKQEFSSLMFLEPSPPVVTRRSRLDELLLLILRSLALALLAFAFMRPFWRGNDALSLENVRGRRIVILVDTSASMRRDDLWEQASVEVNAVINDLAEADSAAIIAFDREARLVADFSLDRSNTVADRKRLAETFAAVKPTWFETKFDRAMLRAIDLLNDTDEQTIAGARQVILISDLQAGGTRDELQKLEWPDSVPVDIRPIAPAKPTNASLRLIEQNPGEPVVDGVKVRLSNSMDAKETTFAIQAFNDDQSVDRMSKHGVPAGQSRTVVFKRASTDFDRIVLSGDGSEFDNTWFIARPEPATLTVRYWGKDTADDADGSLYYFDRALREGEHRTLEIKAAADGLLNSQRLDLHFVTHTVDTLELPQLVESVESGTNALVVLDSIEMARQLSGLVGQLSQVDDNSSENDPADKLLADIDFSDPLFTKFASPRFNDFTDVRFWQSVAVALAEDSNVDVIARFDDRSPAIWTRTIGAGKVFVFASGWQPTSSQLALSNKFVPLLEGIVTQSLPKSLDSRGYSVGDVVTIQRPANSASSTIRKPDGAVISLGDESAEFRETTFPGIYELAIDSQTRRFAVNLSATESQTAPLQASDFEQLGVRLGVQTAQAAEYDRLRTLRDQELESQQKIWKWSIVMALAFIAAETWLSGARSRLISAAGQNSPTDGVTP